MATSYIFLADGFEEIEAIAPTDILRRAQVDVKTVSISGSTTVKGANGIAVVADTTIDKIKPTTQDWLIAPGGLPGATNLAACGMLSDLLRTHWMGGGHVASICASPAVVLAPLGILRGQTATCYPTFKADVTAGGATYVDSRVVESGNLITANGPSSALLFGYAIAAAIQGNDVASSVASGMLV